MRNTNYFKTALFLICLLVPPVWSQQQIKVTPGSSIARMRTLYKIEFITEQALSSDAVLEIVFPKSYIVAKDLIAGSSTINGGFKVEVRDDTVQVARTGLGNVVPAGKSVDVLVSDIINPEADGKDYEIVIKVKNNSFATTSHSQRVPIQINARQTNR